MLLRGFIMTTVLRIMFLVVLCESCLACGATCFGQESEPITPNDEATSQSWYQPSTYQPLPRAIIHERAFMRANQRQARLAAMSWYGMYNARPTAGPTPFTSIYSPVWQQPGGRPFAWHASSRPTYFFYR
jgi:hypothetical protein